MNEISIFWLWTITENLHPNRLIIKDEERLNFDNHFVTLKKGTQQFQLYFIDLMGRYPRKAKAILTQLTIVSDTIYGYMVSVIISWNEHLCSSQVRHLYCRTLDLLELLLEFGSKFEVYDLINLPLTRYSLQSVRMQLKIRINSIRQRISTSCLNPLLGEVLLSGFKLLIKKKEMSRSQVEHALIILEELERLQEQYR